MSSAGRNFAGVPSSYIVRSQDGEVIVYDKDGDVPGMQLVESG